MTDTATVAVADAKLPLTNPPASRPTPPISAGPAVWHELAQALHREARLIDDERFDEWLDEMVHPDIRYRVFNTELHMRKDRRFKGAERQYAWDDGLDDIRIKVKAWQSGLQWSADPKERLRHHIGNVEVYRGGSGKEFVVHSNCWVVRNRRVYEEMTFSYGRTDVWQQQADGRLLLKERVCDVDARFVHGKNLAFFL